jgi:TMEM175 potassium channel family protein
MDGQSASADSRRLIDVGGWDAFMHGVFAIAVTLLVLDIRVPDAATIDSGSALIGALGAQFPRYAAYVLGFLFLGEYWISVNRTMRMLRGIDHWFLVLGLVFLMVIASVPFATALLAEYIGQGSGQAQVAIVIFLSWQLVLAVQANILIHYGVRGGRLLKPTVPASGLRIWLRVVALGPLIWTVALAAALFVSNTVALVLTAVLAVVFMLDLPTAEGGDRVPA